MGKRKRAKKKTRADSASRRSVAKDLFDPQRLSAWLQAYRPLLPAAGVFAVILLALLGLERLRQHVSGWPEFAAPLRIELVDTPDWVDREGWRPHIMASLHLKQAHIRRDDNVVKQVHDRFEASGWVSDVERVARGMDGRVLVACAYRRPIAMIHFHGEFDEEIDEGFVAVDEKGVRLPEIYDHVGEDSGWLRIFGVESPLPERGQPFEGEDAQAAVKLAGVIAEQDFAPRICGINVRNFRGRFDRRDTHIVLLTRDGGRIKWGSAIGEEVEEAHWQDKLRVLSALFHRGTPRGEIDASIFRDRVIIEPAQQGLRTADGSQPR